MLLPYGRAPFWVLICSIISGIILLKVDWGYEHKKPDLVFTLFDRVHLENYSPIIKEFEKKHNIKVQSQIVDVRVLPQRLQNAYLADVDVPDIVEMEARNIGFFTRGPLKDIGFLDLTERIRNEKLDEKFVESRLKGLSSRGRYFGLPNDVHPVIFVYRKDIVNSLGYDMQNIKTWEQFTEMARAITGDLDGDGSIDRYALDLPFGGNEWLHFLILQRGGRLFDEQRNLKMNSDIVAKTIFWYAEQISGETQIAFSAGWGQGFYRAISDGLVLFVLAPDWRLKMIENGTPEIKGKLALCSLPLWSDGGHSTTTHGGSGIFISKKSKRPDLAWELAKELYFNIDALNKSFSSTYIIPAFKGAWDIKSMKEKREHFGGVRVGEFYSSFADDVPAKYNTPYTEIAISKISGVLSKAVTFRKKNGDGDLLDYIRQKLSVEEEYMKTLMERNKFMEGEDEK